MNEQSYNKRIFTEKELQDIKTSYLNGESSVKIGKRYGTDHKPILRELHNMGVTVDSKISQRKYHINEEYFDIIDTPNKAYFLGFLYADGNNNIKKKTVSISLEEQDKHILESFRKELQYEKQLQFFDYSNKHDFGYSYKNQYRLIFFSSHMCSELNNKGMFPNKSLILDFPDFLDDELMRHFVRGYFDGDGSFCPHILKNGKFQPLITFTSTDIFCKKLQSYLRKELNIPCGNIYDTSCHNGVTKVLSFSGTNQVKTFLDWLYKDAELYLFRKYKRYLESYNINNSLSA